MSTEAAHAPVLPEGYTPQEWIYLGKAITIKGKLSDLWQKPDGTETLLDTKNIGPVGATYSIHYNAALGKYFSSGPFGPRYLKPADFDSPLRAAWAAKSRAEVAQYELNQRQARAKRAPDGLTELLAPIRKLYQRTILPSRKAAFLAVCIEEITRWKAREEEE